MDVERLLSEEAVEWAELQRLLARIPRERLEEPSLTPDGWSPKDLMFHMGAWLAECGVILERIRMGTYPAGGFELPDDEVDRMNREWFEISRTLDVQTVRAELYSSRARMMQEWGALEEITPAAWEWFEESGPIHYREHVSDLGTWLEA